jgi:glyoxylate reductase
MNWIKSKMGSQGWDITDDDVKKPSVLFLAPMKFAHQEMEDFQEYFVVKVPSLQDAFYHQLLSSWY